MKTLSLIIPIYNEENTLENIVSKTLQIESETLKLGVNLELVLVDDCSSDNSLEIANKLAQENNKIKVFHHKKNQGKGAALKTGFNFAQGDFIGIQDADDEYNPFDYLKLLAPLLKDKADVCYGSRYLKQDTRRILYFWHTFMNKGLTLLTNMYTNLDITDMETCYKCFKREVIQNMKLGSQRFGIEVEMTAKFAKSRILRIWEEPISYNPRRYADGKKITWKDGFAALWHIIVFNCFTSAENSWKKPWEEVLNKGKEK